MECTVRGIPVFYEEAGAGGPLLMLHGWPSDHRLTSNFMEPILTERSGWRRIYPDLPGMGKTRARIGSPTRMICWQSFSTFWTRWRLASASS